MPAITIRQGSLALMLAALLAAAVLPAAPHRPPTAVAEVYDVPPKGPRG